MPEGRVRAFFACYIPHPNPLPEGEGTWTSTLIPQEGEVGRGKFFPCPALPYFCLFARTDSLFAFHCSKAILTPFRTGSCDMSDRMCA
ncbi:hypothetical protein GMPD_40090 [Geomonas paludis]|uniref:Uncharacterized protein n=1 Tax=Geomonas paludis TaxID=2740185 RepID=A0A6V8N155_9BACT|nr:hypothetical protein GMPD_40090 [Geomonas paludis]